MNPKESPVTLFVKDPQREYKDLLSDLKIGFVSRVVGLDKLNKKHKTFEAKRQLLKEADLFLVDDRVMPEVGRAIGKMWRDAKKYVVPFTLSTQIGKPEN
jgi:ribosome biogenesis protein UTP30